jgi:hypothetical protein
MMRKISEVTRRDIFDLLRIGYIDQSTGKKFHFSRYGSIGEIAFLERLYKLSNIESYDGRFSNAAGDIRQHTVNNDDWEEDWIFSDDRFGLAHGDDEEFLNFLCETFHPAVRSESDNWRLFLEKFNELLMCDGYEFYEKDHMSGRTIYAWRSLADKNSLIDDQIKTLVQKFDSNYIAIQIEQMRLSLEQNPADAIGKAKELLESCCKTILDSKKITWDKDWNVQKFVKTTCKSLNLTPNDIPDTAKASETIKSILGNLASISTGIAELRNSYGSGHGKSAKYKGLSPRHARLAVGSASTAVLFLWQTFEEQEETYSVPPTVK